MRRLLFSALLLVPAAALVVSACVGDDPTIGGDTQTADGSTFDAIANGDSAVADGSIPIDAGPPCIGRWCTCGTPAKSAFCDDFDRSTERLADEWSYDGSFASTVDGGSLKLSATAAESSPRSMYAMVKGNNLQQLSEALTEILSDKPSTIAFDLLLDGAGGNCSGTTMTFAQVGIDTSYTPTPLGSVRFSTVNGVPQLGLFNTGQARINGDASLPSTWVRIRMTTKLGVLDGGGNGMTASISVTPPGSDDSADASVLLSGSIPITTGTSESWLSVGVLNVENTNPCAVYIDDVAIYQ